MIHAVQTFGLILVELLVLFSLLSVLVALVNRRFGSDRIESWMADGHLPGPVNGLLLGAITPFCSCSTLPVLAGMLKSGVALRTSMTFLISSPFLDPIIVAVPLAAVLGVPLYVRIETMLPIGLALSSAGMGLGAVFVLMIGGAGASIPEVLMRTAMFTPRLVVTIIVTAIASGYLIPLIA